MKDESIKILLIISDPKGRILGLGSDENIYWYANHSIKTEKKRYYHHVLGWQIYKPEL